MSKPQQSAKKISVGRKIREENARRDALLDAHRAVLSAALPEGFQWGREATEHFEFGKQRAAQAVWGLI